MEAVTSSNTSAPANGEGGDEANGATSPAAATAAAAGRGRGRGRGVGATSTSAQSGAGGVGATTIWGVKGAAAAEKKSGTGRKLKPGEIRVQKDVSELDGGECATAVFPNANDLMNFEVIVAPDQGFWQGYQYTFQFHIPDMYPHESPKVKCVDKIYHPNIDLGGNVCLNILRADWKPVLDINAVIYGLIVLFVQPNPDDPLNHEAAKCLRESLYFMSTVSGDETD